MSSAVVLFDKGKLSWQRELAAEANYRLKSEMFTNVSIAYVGRDQDVAIHSCE